MDQATSHERVAQQVKQENESRSGDSETKGIVPQRENTQSSSSSYFSEAHLEPIKIVAGISASKLQRALHYHLLPTENTMGPLKTKKKVKVPTRFGHYLTQSSVIKKEKNHTNNL